MYTYKIKKKKFAQLQTFKTNHDVNVMPVSIIFCWHVKPANAANVIPPSCDDKRDQNISNALRTYDIYGNMLVEI